MKERGEKCVDCDGRLLNTINNNLQINNESN